MRRRFPRPKPPWPARPHSPPPSLKTLPKSERSAPPLPAPLPPPFPPPPSLSPPLPPPQSEPAQPASVGYAVVSRPTRAFSVILAIVALVLVAGCGAAGRARLILRRASRPFRRLYRHNHRLHRRRILRRSLPRNHRRSLRRLHPRNHRRHHRRSRHYHHHHRPRA